jgi:hypothetical protein
MPVPDVALKSNVFLDLDTVKDWLKIPLTNTDHDIRVKRLMNMVTDMCEKYVDGPMKVRTYIEERDGDSSNTIVPDHYPIRSVTEIKVDMNREFGPTTIIPATNYVLRGTDDAVGKLGSDIVLHDDNSTSIIGRIFTGSVAGSIRVTYTAGWGNDVTDMPSDLTQAVLMGIEYYYLVRENRELNLKSKNNQNQGYTRQIGLPEEVTEILDTYKDYGFGHANTPQKNTFVK